MSSAAATAHAAHAAHALGEYVHADKRVRQLYVHRLIGLVGDEYLSLRHILVHHFHFDLALLDRVEELDGFVGRIELTRLQRPTRRREFRSMRGGRGRKQQRRAKTG
ncbi:MAG: hypothetical protein C0483_08640 [Pirellula sp.]|nr:hypothetical protein [Pirellula sp.]